MTREAHLIFSFEGYLEVMNFNESLLKDQIAYQLFYVTKIARLRKDMTPEIIADRLNDQIRILNEKYRNGEGYHNLKLTTPESVEEVLKNTPEYFAVTPHDDISTDRLGHQHSYVLTNTKEKDLKNKLHYYWKNNLMTQRVYDKTYNILLSLLFLLIGVSIIVFQINNSNKLGISWQDYQKKANWEQLDNSLKSVYILYYITKVIEFNDDMSAEVLSERLVSLKCNFTSPDSIKSFMAKSDLVIPSPLRKEAFMISPKGEKVISKKVGVISPYQYEGDVDFNWIWKNRPDIIWGTLVVLISVVGPCIRFAYNQGKKLNLAYEEMI